MDSCLVPEQWADYSSTGCDVQPGRGERYSLIVVVVGRQIHPGHREATVAQGALHHRQISPASSS
jgi:hypothetical protein